jgi:hypothetical protein
MIDPEKFGLSAIRRGFSMLLDAVTVIDARRMRE